MFVGSPPPSLELLSPQPIRIYGRRRTFSIQINATVTDQLGSSVKANSSLLSVSLVSSTNGVINVQISSYDTESGQLVLIAPSEFYNSYVNATFNTSYFEVTLASPVSSLMTSITFSPEYLGTCVIICILYICILLFIIDILDLSFENGRRTFAVGEILSITCVTIPPNIPVVWEVFDGNEFVELTDDRVQYDPPSIRTTLQLTDLSLNDSSNYQCHGTGGLANETATDTITVLPGKYKYMSL